MVPFSLGFHLYNTSCWTLLHIKFSFSQWVLGLRTGQGEKLCRALFVQVTAFSLLDFFRVSKLSQSILGLPIYLTSGLSQQLNHKEFNYQCRRCRFHPWVRNTPGEETGNSLHYSCLGNPMDRGAWWATVHGVKKQLDVT